MSHTNGEAGDAASTAPTGRDANLLIGCPTNTKLKPGLTSLIRAVVELWPVFVADGWRPHKPLAIGIDKQLVDTGVLKGWEAALVLRHYVRRRMYVAAVAAGGYRYNLDGTIAGEVSAEHIAAAKGSLAGMDARAARAVEAAKAARQAERAKLKAERDAEQAKAGREFIAAKRAAREVLDKPMRPAPGHISKGRCAASAAGYSAVRGAPARPG
jgi:sRNA-binding protein